MPNSFVQKLASELDTTVEAVESKWKQAKKIVADQYPDKSEDDDSFWALVTTLTKKLLGIKEHIIMGKKMLKEDYGDGFDFSSDPNFEGAGMTFDKLLESEEKILNKLTEATEYKGIFFSQGDEANEYLDMIDEKGPEYTLDYILDLLPSDFGEGGTVRDGPAAGTDDNTFKKGNYILNWNSRIGYVGVERIDQTGD